MVVFIEGMIASRDMENQRAEQAAMLARIFS